MIWACFSYFRNCDLVFLEGRVDGNKYVEVLQKKILLWASLTQSENWNFQPDNEALNVSMRVNYFMRERNMKVFRLAVTKSEPKSYRRCVLFWLVAFMLKIGNLITKQS